jgi:hypothetical protein
LIACSFPIARQHIPDPAHRLLTLAPRRFRGLMFPTMSATKILWGQILLVSAVGLAFLRTATEWTAWQLGFQAQLGLPWFEFLGWPVYRPPAFF